MAFCKEGVASSVEGGVEEGVACDEAIRAADVKKHDQALRLGCADGLYT